MNKLLSYVVLDLETDSGEALKVPVKIGTYVLEKVAENFKLELYEFGALFQSIERKNENGETILIEVPRDPVRFYKSILLHGANYAALVEGRPAYQEKDAYQWLDQLGFNSPQSISVLAAFVGSIRNGGTPIRMVDETDEKKSL